MTSLGASVAPDKKSSMEALIFFLTAYLFFLLGLFYLAANSDILVKGGYAHPKIIASLHFVTLGWLSTSIFAALRVFLNVALGEHFCAKFLYPYFGVCWSLGVICLFLGLYLTLPFVMIYGAIFLGIAIAIFTLMILPPLLKAKRNGISRFFLLYATASLWIVWLLGFNFLLARAGMPMIANFQNVLQAHIVFAIFGWVGSVVIGVGTHLLPMFWLCKESAQWPTKITLILYPTFLTFAFVGVFLEKINFTYIWACAGICSFLWGLQVLLYFKSRLRKDLDSGMLLAMASTCVSLLAWMLLIPGGKAPSFIALLVLGWLSLFTFGIYHRVIPFLFWFKRYVIDKKGKGKLPKVNDLINPRLASFSVVSSLAGALVLCVGLLVAHALSVQLGIYLLTFGVFSFSLQFFFMIHPQINNKHRSSYGQFDS